MRYDTALSFSWNNRDNWSEFDNLYSWKIVCLKTCLLMALCGFLALFRQQFRRIFERVLRAYPVVNSVNSNKTLWTVFYHSRYNLFSFNIPLNTQETLQRVFAKVDFFHFPALIWNYMTVFHAVGIKSQRIKEHRGGQCVYSKMRYFRRFSPT